MTDNDRYLVCCHIGEKKLENKHIFEAKIGEFWLFHENILQTTQLTQFLLVVNAK